MAREELAVVLIDERPALCDFEEAGATRRQLPEYSLLGAVDASRKR